VTAWTHLLCRACWTARYAGREPPIIRRLEPFDAATCCACGVKTSSGIYVRAHPASLDCHGVHLEPEAVQKGPLVGQ